MRFGQPCNHPGWRDGGRPEGGEEQEKKLPWPLEKWGEEKKKEIGGVGGGKQKVSCDFLRVTDALVWGAP